MLLEMIKIQQIFDNNTLNDIEAAVKKELSSLKPYIKKGSRIAITAGSRGIDRIPLVLRSVVRYVKACGGEPFLVPSMGSHGGATGEGQLKILEELGITPDTVEAPILSSMDVVQVGAFTPDEAAGKSIKDLPVVIDRNAYEADGIIAVNRIKVHTSFHSQVESGIVKMMVVGLGKKVQAENIHSYGTRGLREYLVPMAEKILKTGKIIAGIGLIENAYDKIAEIRALPPDEIIEGEKQLLEKSRGYLPGLPVDCLDVLIVEQLGKNISGTGMDTNVIGRMKIQGEPEPGKPSIGRIVVLTMTKETKGNAYGIGLADFTTRALADQIDYKAMYTNAITSTFTERVKIPVIAADENEALEMALKSCGLKDAADARIIRIKNTLEMGEMWVSSPVYRDIRDMHNIKIIKNKQD